MNAHDTDKPTINNGWSSASSAEREPEPKRNSDAGRALLVGLLGGAASAVGYLVYSRLPPEQKDVLHKQVRGVVDSRISEIRSNFNV